jgi:hypothetical protein
MKTFAIFCLSRKDGTVFSQEGRLDFNGGGRPDSLIIHWTRDREFPYERPPEIFRSLNGDSVHRLVSHTFSLVFSAVYVALACASGAR